MSYSKRERLWNRNFFLLWQGRLISFVGDMAYQFALGFWVLHKTGSTAIMGSVIAAGFVPQIFVGMFAGTYVDRHDRKKIIVITDVIRGFAVFIGGLIALFDKLPIWGLLLISIIIGVCSTFFDLASDSTLPDIVPLSTLDRANSLFSIIKNTGRIFGKGVAGFLLSIIGAPILFIINGISYFLSAISESYMTIPKSNIELSNKKFFVDLKDGGKFVWEHSALRALIIIVALLNFTSGVGEVLLLPYFNQEIWLGPEKFGIFEAVGAIGSLVAMIVLTIIDIPQSKRAFIFISFLILGGFIMSCVPLLSIFLLMLTCVTVTHFLNSIISVIFRTVLQSTVTSDMRGKTFGFVQVIIFSLMPLGMVVGGVLGEFFPIQYVIFTSFILTALVGLLLIPNKNIKKYINLELNSE